MALNGLRLRLRNLAFKNAKMSDPDFPFQEVTLKDGRILEVSPSLKVGAVCLLKDNAPLQMGLYELTDGTKVSIGVGGVIGLIQRPEKKKAPVSKVQPFTRPVKMAFESDEIQNRIKAMEDLIFSDGK